MSIHTFFFSFENKITINTILLVDSIESQCQVMQLTFTLHICHNFMFSEPYKRGR